MALHSRPRFYALIWGQLIGLVIIVAGMIPYWFGWGAAKVPRTITGRVIAICVLILIMVLIPLLMNSAASIFKGLGKNIVENKEPLADNPSAVRRVLWIYMYVDFILLTYLVHITGGIAGSMYAGVYLMLPSVPLLLRLDQVEVRRTRWLAVVCASGILLSFFMSHYHYYEFNAEQFEHAFDIAVTAVTIAAMLLTAVEIAVLRYEGEKVEGHQSVDNQGTIP